jgi:hypothetical protein
MFYPPNGKNFWSFDGENIAKVWAGMEFISYNITTKPTGPGVGKKQSSQAIGP